MSTFHLEGWVQTCLLSLKLSVVSGEFFCSRNNRLIVILSNTSVRVIGFIYLSWQVNVEVLNNNLGQNIADKFTKISITGFCMECFTFFFHFLAKFLITTSEAELDLHELPYDLSNNFGLRILRN